MRHALFTAFLLLPLTHAANAQEIYSETFPIDGDISLYPDWGPPSCGSATVAGEVLTFRNPCPNPPAFIPLNVPLPDAFILTLLIGGGTVPNVGIHIGRNAIVFHPGLSGTQVRVESASGGTGFGKMCSPWIMSQNIDTGFTLAAGVMHHLELVADGTGLFTFTLTDGNDPNNTFTTCYTDPDSVGGSFALRSSSNGGSPIPAMFDDLLIRLSATAGGTDISVGTAPCDVVLADFDSDGFLEIATANSGSDDVTILFNDGSGAFPSEVTLSLPAGDIPTSLAAGNLVPGGRIDLAVATKGTDVVRIFSNDLSGIFTETSEIDLSSVGSNPLAIAAGDLDGTGIDDLAIALQGEIALPNSGGLALILDGSLMTVAGPSSGFQAVKRVEICDLDGDGDNDLVSTMSDTQFGFVTDNVLLYENEGGFSTSPIELSVIPNPNGICCGDLDGDGDLDIAVTAESSPLSIPGGVYVFSNDGLTPGSWSATSFSTSCAPFEDGLSPVDLACADLDNDGIPGFSPSMDLVAVNFGSEDVTRFNGFDASTCSFGSIERSSAGDVPIALALGELNGDRCGLDVVVVNKASNDVTVFLTDGVGLAQTTPFGRSCPELGPQITAVGLPQVGTTFGVRVTNALPNAPVLLGGSLRQETALLGSCELYLAQPMTLWSTFTNSSGQAQVNLVLPPQASTISGCDVFFQYFIFDPNGPYVGRFAFSNGLRAKIGL